MANAVVMPRSGETTTVCTLTMWHKEPGDKIKIGDVLFSYETEKAAFECESSVEGTLLEIFYEEGDEVPVNMNVCVIGEPGEDVSEFRPADLQAATEPAPSVSAVTEAVAEEALLAELDTASPLLKISPRARNLAERGGIDPSLATPTGPGGRIVENDIRKLMLEGVPDQRPASDVSESAAASLPAPGIAETEYEDVKFSGIRRVIAKSMSTSLQSMAQLTHHFSFDATAIQTYRAELKSAKDNLADITIGDMILFAVSRTLLGCPDLNANIIEENSIRRFKHVNLGVAVDTPRGLMVPTIFKSDQKSLLEISGEVKALASACRAGNINPDLLQGASFTVSNLGSLGVEMFTPVINPPQTGIIGVCSIIMRQRLDKSGDIEIYPAMGLSLSYDHRAVDGAPASRFMNELCRNLEQFTLLLAK